MKSDSSKKNNQFLVVGTDTGVGKTIFVSLLCNYIRNRGNKALPIKPFCSGGKLDLNMLLSAQGEGLKESEINFWYCDESVSPAAWEFRTGGEIDINYFVEKLKKWGKVDQGYDILLVEGVGGLLSPVTQKHTIATIGQKIGFNVILIAQNRVGVINHVLLTIEAALSRGLSVACIILMEQEEPDDSAADNIELIRLHLPSIDDFKGIYEFPWLGGEADNPNLIAKNVIKAESVLNKIFDEVINP